jgi:spore germination protein KC
MEQCAKQAIKKMQSYQTDSLGIGTEIYRKNPDLWDQIEKDWESKMFPQLQVEVVAEANIRQVGMMGPQLQLPEQEVKR